MRHYTAHRCLLHSIDKHHHMTYRKTSTETVYFSDSCMAVFDLFDVVYIFLRRNMQWVYSLPKQTQYFLMMTQSDKQELIWKPKPKARKITSSHQFPRSALQYQDWHFHLFRKIRNAWEVTGMLDSLEVSHAKLIHILCEAYE